MAKKVNEHSFSIEMKSKNGVRQFCFLDKKKGCFFFEGDLGELKNASMVEGLMLHLEGVNGVLRVDISQDEIAQCLESTKLPGDEQQ